MTMILTAANDTSASSIYADRSWNHAKEIASVSRAVYWAMLGWCATNCTQPWYHQIVREHAQGLRVCFFFDNQRDFIVFLLKWA